MSNDAPQHPRVAGDPHFVLWADRKRTLPDGTEYIRFADMAEFESRRLWLYRPPFSTFRMDGRECMYWDVYLKMTGEGDQ